MGNKQRATYFDFETDLNLDTDESNENSDKTLSVVSDKNVQSKSEQNITSNAETKCPHSSSKVNGGREAKRQNLKVGT